LGMHWIFDVEQQPVSGTRARRQADRGIDGDVVALVGIARLVAAFAVRAAIVQAIHRTRAGIDEQTRAGDDLRFMRLGYWDLDHVDTEQRGVGIFVWLLA